MENNSAETELEAFWDRLLSRDAAQVQAAFNAVSAAEQAAVLEHLKRMAAEPGWHAEQRKSAQAALDALEQG